MTDTTQQYRIQNEPFYQQQSNEVALYEAAYKAKLPVMVKGPTGCGKSRFVEYMAFKLGKPLITVACNEDMTASDLVGRYLLEANGTRWLDGPLSVAARIGAVCYLDKKGELIQAHPDFQLVISYNPGYPSPSLALFFEKSPQLLEPLSLQGLSNWVDYGIRNTSHHPEQQRAYFSLTSADSRAVLQRERHGTLLIDHTRALDLYLQALWQDADVLVPYSTAFEMQRQPMPYFDAMGIRLPDVYNERAGISGMDRYRAALAHIAAHRRWSTAIFGDNFSPAQRMAIECFEDSRIEALAMREYPGLRCTRTRLRVPATRPPIPACAIGSRCCRARCLTRRCAFRMCRSATGCSASTPPWRKANRAPPRSPAWP